jgi:Na+-transporting NADH:ubiquinone oxidoreductase subunit A
MSKVKKIKKGLNINLKGKAEKVLLKTGKVQTYAIKPTDFTGIVPKLTVKENDAVKAGSALFYDKYNPEVLFTSPVSGMVKAIIRGERRKILEVVIEPDGKNGSEIFTKASPSTLDKQTIINNLQKSGLWAAIIMRPYAVIAKASDTPKAIFISGIDSAPLGVDYNFIMNGLDKEFQAGIDALAKLTEGKVHLGIDANHPSCSAFENAKNIEKTEYSGPHPIGNVGTQIYLTDPINKGDVIWTIDPQNVVSIGRLFLEGKYDASKIIAIAGSEVKNTGYFKTISGTKIEALIEDNISCEHPRFISGNVLTGSRIETTGHVGFYDSLLSVIPEGDKYEFMGWVAPGFNKFSLSRTFFSWLCKEKEYTIDTNLKGGRRALMITGTFEKVFPMDIFPMQLIKAIIIEDIDLMEKLGIYEVAEEDFALCEFVDTSKTDIQEIVRKGLDLMIKEMS